MSDTTCEMKQEKPGSRTIHIKIISKYKFRRP